MKRISLFIFLLSLTSNSMGEVVTSETFKVESDKQYNWLVKRGDLRFKLENKVLVLEVDSKGEKSCYLTVQDALDVYSILQQFGQKLFDESDTSKKYKKNVVQESDNSFKWNFNDNILKVYLNKESEFLQISSTNEKPISLDIGLISELAQVIGIILNNAENEGAYIDTHPNEDKK